MRRIALVGLLLAAVACGSSGKHVAVRSDSSTTTSMTAASSTTTQPPPDTVPDLGVHPHFDTPEAAMKYLATAWNSHDIVAERHVTNPAAREQLDAMRDEAVNLRFDHCDLRQGLGDYDCWFKHDYPKDTPTTMDGGVGQADVLVAPADGPGWYMTVFEGCG